MNATLRDALSLDWQARFRMYALQQVFCPPPMILAGAADWLDVDRVGIAAVTTGRQEAMSVLYERRVEPVRDMTI